MTYYIIGQYQDNEPETIDETEDKQDARYLRNEYRIAFGNDWKITISTQEATDQ